jgi:hypothetical protein
VSYSDGGTRAIALEHGEITEQIIGAAFEVSSEQFRLNGSASPIVFVPLTVQPGVQPISACDCFPVRVQSVFNPWLK